MIKDAKADFKKPIVEDVEIDNKATKVEVSDNGNRVYYGCDGVGEVRRGIDSWLYNKGISSNLSKFIENSHQFRHFYFEIFEGWKNCRL